MQIDYKTLADRVGDMVLCNSISQVDENLFDNIENGGEQPEDWDETADGEWNFPEIYQYYAITKGGADYLKRNTSEIVFYSDLLGVYIWGITHWGTSWDGVYTDIKE
jgi:hypothetical protein